MRVPGYSIWAGSMPGVKMTAMKVHSVYMRPMPVQVQSTGDKADETEQKTHGKTDQIEVRPGHVRLLCAPGTLARPAGVSGRSASNSRSAKPGVFNISPSNKTHPRVSFSRAS